MANNHRKRPTIQSLFFLLSALVADSARLEPWYQTSQNSPSKYPQRHDFPNEQLYNAYLIIHRFKNTVTCDPRKISSTWIGQDICGKDTYLGFYCATPQEHSGNLTVTSVIFNGFGLCAPKLQGFVDQLPDLAHFQATSNNFGGGLPSLAGLNYKGNLNASSFNAQHSGSRRALGKHQTGAIIDGYGAKLTTPGDLVQTIMHPGDTMVSIITPKSKKPFGPSTTTLGFPKTSYVALANNKLTGPIPSSIAQARDTLVEVLLLNNQLSGCLPQELGMLNKATVLDAGMNQITGPIPSSFSCLTSVEQLNLGGNRLYGEIPDALCRLAAGPAGRLANLTLSSNYFTSVGPACLSLIKDGVLNVNNNCIPGFANQRRPAECASFLSQPKRCPAAITTHVACPAGAANAAAAPADRVAKDYSSYVTYATLHE